MRVRERVSRNRQRERERQIKRDRWKETER